MKQPFIKINGVALPPPKYNTVEWKESVIVDGSRNANGVFVGQRIGRPIQKLANLVWPVLSPEEWSKILRLLEPFVVNVTYPDAVTGKMTTRKMYCGDKSARIIDQKDDGTPKRYADCTVNLIDTGE